MLITNRSRNPDIFVKNKYTEIFVNIISDSVVISGHSVAKFDTFGQTSPPTSFLKAVNKTPLELNYRAKFEIPCVRFLVCCDCRRVVVPRPSTISLAITTTDLFVILYGMAVVFLIITSTNPI